MAYVDIQPSSSSGREHQWITTVTSFNIEPSSDFLLSKIIGGRQAEDIVNWLLKKTGPPAKEVKTVEEAKDLIENNNVVIIGFFKDQSTAKAKAFLEVAASVDDHPFAITSEDALYEEYGVKCGSILLFKKVKNVQVLFISFGAYLRISLFKNSYVHIKRKIIIIIIILL